MIPISIKIVRQTSSVRTIYSCNEGEWVYAISFYNQELLESSLTGLSDKDVVVYFQLKADGCIVSFAKSNGVTAYLYLSDKLNISASELSLVCNTVSQMINGLRVDKPASDAFFSQTYPELENVVPYESEAAADSVGVLYYHGEANLVDALLHARLSCFSSCQFNFLVEKDSSIEVGSSVQKINDRENPLSPEKISDSMQVAENTNPKKTEDTCSESASLNSPEKSPVSDNIHTEETKVQCETQDNQEPEELELGATPHIGIDLPKDVTQGISTFLPLRFDKLITCGNQPVNPNSLISNPDVSVHFKDGMPFVSPLIIPIGSIVHLELRRPGYKTVKIRVAVTQLKQNLKLPQFTWQSIGERDSDSNLIRWIVISVIIIFLLSIIYYGK